MSSVFNDQKMQEAIIKAFDPVTNTLSTNISAATVDVAITALSDSIAIADESGNKATTTLVSTKRGLDVNVIDQTIDKSTDSIATESYEQSVRVDDASSTVTYLGYAAIGTATSAASWKVKKLSVSGNVTSITYADSNSNYDNIWDNRAVLTYG